MKRVALLRPEPGEKRGGYPFDLPAVRLLGERPFTAPVTVFVGENGMGKSTLLEAIAVHLGLNAEGGSRNLRFTTKATHSVLFRALRVVRSPHRPRDRYFLRAESFYNVASEIHALDEHPDNVQGGPRVIESYGGVSLHEQSHGESFFALFLNRFRGPGLYLLDEPEAALSPQRQLALLVRMHDLVAAGSQFVLATHSPILMAYPGADVWLFSEKGIANVAAADTDHSRITKRFLNDPDGMLRELLDG
jgi:predicted ATPase